MVVDGKNQFVRVSDWLGQITGQITLPEVADGLVVQGVLVLNGSTVNVR
jgi:hypothetical protein